MVENLRLNTYPSTLWRGQAACLTASALLQWPQEPDVHVVQMRKLRVTRSFNLQSRSIFGKLGIKFVDSTSPYGLIKDMYYGFYFLGFTSYLCNTADSNTMLKPKAIIAGIMENQAARKNIIRFSFDNSIANISLYALSCLKFNFGYFITFETVFQALTRSKVLRS